MDYELFSSSDEEIKKLQAFPKKAGEAYHFFMNFLDEYCCACKENHDHAFVVFATVMLMVYIFFFGKTDNCALWWKLDLLIKEKNEDCKEEVYLNVVGLIPLKSICYDTLKEFQTEQEQVYLSFQKKITDLETLIKSNYKKTLYPSWSEYRPILTQKIQETQELYDVSPLVPVHKDKHKLYAQRLLAQLFEKKLGVVPWGVVAEFSDMYYQDDSKLSNPEDIARDYRRFKQKLRRTKQSKK